MIKELKTYYEATDALAKAFVKKHFEENDFIEPLQWWVGDDIGGVYCVNDYYFDVDFMTTALKNKATLGQVIDYYDLSLEAYENSKTIANFKNYIKYGFTYV